MNTLTRYEPETLGIFFLTVLPFCCWRRISVLEYITSFLGLILYLENNSVSLRSCLNLKPNTFYGKGSYKALRRRKNLYATQTILKPFISIFQLKNNKHYYSLVNYSSLNVLGTVGFYLKFFVLANHNLNCNTKSFPMNDYKGKLA